MKLDKKKIVAREFLILIVTIGISILAYLSTFPYNHKIIEKISTLKKQIPSLEDTISNLERTYNKKAAQQRSMYKAPIREMMEDMSLAESWKIFSEIQKSDSLVYRWNNVWDNSIIEAFNIVGFQNGKQLNQFIINNTITKEDSNNKKQSEKLEIKLKKINKDIYILKKQILTPKEQLNFWLSAFVVSAFITFILRYLFIAIVWSIKILKEKS